MAKKFSELRSRMAPEAQARAAARAEAMLEAACDRAQAVVLDQVLFSLDAGKFKQFTEMLDAPAGLNPGLERLMAVKAPWSSGAG